MCPTLGLGLMVFKSMAWNFCKTWPPSLRLLAGHRGVATELLYLSTPVL